MKKNLEIIEFENKATNTEPAKMYVRFKTSEGWMSCVDSIASNKLKGFVGNSASVEVAESKSGDKVFHNIKKCYGNAESLDAEKIEVVKPGVPQEIKQSPNRNATMYVSYAKDIFCAVMNESEDSPEVKPEEIMTQAINLVKQAKTAFE